LGDRSRAIRRATDTTGHLRRALHEVPGVVGHLHLDQHVAREELALGNRLLAALHLDHFLDRDQDLAELLLQLGTPDPLGERALHAFLESRVRVHHVPLLVGHHSGRPVSQLTSHASDESTAKRNSAMTTTKANTTAVVCTVSLRVGHATRPASARDSCANAKNSLPIADVHATSPPTTIRKRRIGAAFGK